MRKVKRSPLVLSIVSISAVACRQPERPRSTLASMQSFAAALEPKREIIEIDSNPSRVYPDRMLYVARLKDMNTPHIRSYLPAIRSNGDSLIEVGWGRSSSLWPTWHRSPSFQPFNACLELVVYFVGGSPGTTFAIDSSKQIPGLEAGTGTVPPASLKRFTWTSTDSLKVYTEFAAWAGGDLFRVGCRFVNGSRPEIGATVTAARVGYSSFGLGASALKSLGSLPDPSVN
jgi:hypothetical protein